MTVLEVPTEAAARAMELGRRTAPGPSSTRRRPAHLPDAIFAARRLSHAERERAAHPARAAGRRSALVARTRRRAAPPRRAQRRRHARTHRRADPDRRPRSSWCRPCRSTVVDTTGAGDAFNSGFAVALAEGRDIVDAVRFGVVCGGIACTRLGVIPGLPDRASADALFAKPLETVWKERP